LLGISKKKIAVNPALTETRADAAERAAAQLALVLPHPLHKANVRGGYKTRSIFHQPDTHPSLFLNPQKNV